MKFLIIGGAGFIGFHLAKSLSENKKNNIIILDNFQRGKKDKDLLGLLKKKNISLIEKDFEKLNIKSIGKNFDYILHLASIVGVQNVISNPNKVLKQNINLIYKIIDLAKKQTKLKKICFTSTSEIYANSVKFNISKIPSSENDLITINPVIHSRDSYFLAKLICEKILLLSKIPTVIFRLHNIYGPRMGFSHVIPEIFMKILNNKKTIPVFSSNHTRSFCYISDAINQMKYLILKNKIKNIVINIGNDKEEIKIINLVKKIFNILKLKKKIIKKKEIDGSPKRRKPNMKLGYSIFKKRPIINLNEGITKTFEWYKNKI